jgi:hypothetical protein
MSALGSKADIEQAAHARRGGAGRSVPAAISIVLAGYSRKLFGGGRADLIARSLLPASGLLSSGFKWFAKHHVFSLLEGLFLGP